MATKTVEWFSTTDLECACCSNADVILCVTSELIAAKACPTGMTGSETFEYHFIEGKLLSAIFLGEINCIRRWKYLFSYDDTQLVPDTVLTSSDISGVFCKACFTSWVEDLVGNEVTIADNGDNTATFTSQHGCQFTFSTAGGIAGNPAPPNMSVQFNNGGIFGGSADLTWDDTLKNFTMRGQFTGGDAVFDPAKLFNYTLTDNPLIHSNFYTSLTASTNNFTSFEAGAITLVAHNVNGDPAPLQTDMYGVFFDAQYNGGNPGAFLRQLGHNFRSLILAQDNGMGAWVSNPITQVGGNFGNVLTNVGATINADINSVGLVANETTYVQYAGSFTGQLKTLAAIFSGGVQLADNKKLYFGGDGSSQNINNGTSYIWYDTSFPRVEMVVPNSLYINGNATVDGKLTVTGAIDPTHLYLNEQVGDPGPVANEGIFYVKDVAGVTQAFYQASDGTVYQLTPSAGGGTIGGSINPNEVAFGSPVANQIAGTPNFTWNNSTFGILHLAAADELQYNMQVTAGVKVRNWIFGIGVGVPDGSFGFRDETATTNRWTIDLLGNTGFGTITPTARVHATGTDNGVRGEATSNTGDAFGVVGIASTGGVGGTPYGVYGSCSGTADLYGFAGYFAAGDVVVENQFGWRDGVGLNYTFIQPAAAFGSDIVWTLPAAQGGAGTVLTNDGTGILSWGAGGGGGIGGTIQNTQVAFGTGVDTIGGGAALTWDNGSQILNVQGLIEGTGGATSANTFGYNGTANSFNNISFAADLISSSGGRLAGISLKYAQADNFEAAAIIGYAFANSNVVTEPITGIRGVAGSAYGDNYGVQGFALNTSPGVNIGLYGKATGGATNWAGYFEGDANVTGVERIGTTAGTGKLEVATTGALNMAVASTTSVWIHRAGNAGVHIGTTAGGYGAIQDGDPDVALGLTLQRLAGTVAIGPGDPTANMLEVYGDASVQGKLTVTGAIDPTHLYLDEQGGDPTPVANKGVFYTKDIAGVTEPYYLASDGTVTRLTLLSASNVKIQSPLIPVGISLDFIGFDFTTNNTWTGLNNFDVIQKKAGAEGGHTVQVGGTVYNDYADAGSVGTGETDLHSHTVVSNILNSNGDTLRGSYSGTFVNSTSTKQVKIYFGGTAIFDSGALTTTGASSWRVDFIIIRDSASSVRCSTEFSASGVSSILNSTQYSTLGSLDFTVNNTIKSTGTAAGVGAANNDIVDSLDKIEFLPSA